MNIDSHDQLTGMIQFVPTVERILYGARTVDEHLESEVERLNGQRVLLLAPRSLKDQSPFQRVSAIHGKRIGASFTSAYEQCPSASMMSPIVTLSPFQHHYVLCSGWCA